MPADWRKIESEIAHAILQRDVITRIRKDRRHDPDPERVDVHSLSGNMVCDIVLRSDAVERAPIDYYQIDITALARYLADHC